ncbi:MAG: AMP-binding protein [Cocleimonas sp.]
MKTEKHNRIINHLVKIPRDRVFIALQDDIYTFEDIHSLCSEFKTDYPEIIDKNCAIISEDRESLAIYLPAIDNLCKTIFLQPDDIKTREREFYHSANIEIVIKLGNGKVLSVDNIACNVTQQIAETKCNDYILATSGTTGEPKLASYTLSSLIATANKNIDRGTEFIWGLSYDINRFAGLQVYLQSIISGSSLVIPSRTGSMDSLVNGYTEKSVNCLSATPSFWRKMLMAPHHKNIPLKQITLGGEISNQNILTALSNSYPEANIIHIYASTEAGVGFAVKDKKEGFPLDYIDGSINQKCQLKIKDNVLWIKSNHGCTNFIKGNLDVDNNGYINTGDLIKIKNDRVLFLGRESGSINVGGNKVMPEKVESVLEDSNHVHMAKVFAKNNSVLGSLVSAEIVLTDSGKALTNKEMKAEVIAFCRKRLESFEIPALLKRVDMIQTNATGKKIRNTP